MLHIDGTEFGQITIDGRPYSQVLIVGQQILERDYTRLNQLFGTSHQIGDWEMERLAEQNPEIIIVGTGQSGMLTMDQKFHDTLQSRGIEVITTVTPKALKIYNGKVKEGRRVNALLHTTC